jgi:hypothetical protein
MSSPTSNIEAVARDICAKSLSRFGCTGAALANDVDRYWHSVAAQLESGEIDGSGHQLAKFDLETSMTAYRDWCQRHPESKQV